MQQLVLSFAPEGFLHIETFEVLRRGWHVTERSVRPDHRMVGHTGFLTIARRLA
jgi:tRNA (adenine57-N1/adenine58-N1)-methyltransferase